jgi:hypothetical protein
MNGTPRIATTVTVWALFLSGGTALAPTAHPQRQGLGWPGNCRAIPVMV